jgi:hypothetical protein
MTPYLKKEMDKIYDKNDKAYPVGTISSHEYVNLIITDIENHKELKEAKFKLSFWKSKKPNDIKYSVCRGFSIRDVMKEWADIDPTWLVTFTLFGDN